MTAINVRWHTEGRRQPTLIGKDAAGRKIPGGPYIVWQLLALPVAPLMWSTRYSWAGDLSGLAMLVVTGATTGGVFYLIGRLDFAGRNPLLAVGALTAAVLLAMTARSGRLGGTRVRNPTRPRRRNRPAPAWHPHTTSAQPSTDTTMPTSVQPAAAPASTAPTPTDPSSSTAPATYRPQPAAPAAEPPTRMSPLEAFIAAAGKVTT